MYTYKILLIEENPVFFNMWELILSQSVHSYKLDWAVSEKVASKMLKEHYYDVVISDIFLSGGKTGVDIWKTINPEHCTYIFSSSIHQKYFAKLIDGEQRPYLFLEKPLDIDTCIRCMTHFTQEGPWDSAKLTNGNRCG